MVYNTTERIYDLSLLEEKMATEEWKKLYSPVVNRIPTYSEAFLAYLLDELGFTYVQEYIIGKYPIDFFLPKYNLCLEVDSPCYRRNGGKNSKKKKGDIKEIYLRNLGYDLFRFHWVRMALTFNKGITESHIKRLLIKIGEIEISSEKSRESY